MTVPQAISSIPKKILAFLDKHPFPAFFVLLIILLVLVVVGNTLRTPKSDTEVAAPAPKPVQIFVPGEAPKLQFQAQIEKSGTITLVAQTPGVVQKILKKEGDSVKRGNQLFSLSTSYQGGNIPSLSRAISSKNYTFLVENFDAQKDAIQKQRDIAQKVDSQADQLRSITRQSLDETRSLISLNDDIVGSLDKQIANLQAINVNGASDSAILQLKQSKAQTQAALSGLKVTLRNNEYQSADDKEGAQLSDLQRDLALRQLDLQQKTLTLNKEVSSLNLRIAQVSESLMFPAAPCQGIVERVFVKVGQVVNPGTVLATIRGTKNQATAVMMVSGDIARQISRVEASVMMVGDQKVHLIPRYISLEPTEGTLHSVIYDVPDAFADQVSNGSGVEIYVPLSMGVTPLSLGSVSADQTQMIPLDSIYQTQERSYVFVAEDGQAKVKTVTLGQVFGQYVEAVEGISPQDKIILDRTVTEGEVVRAQ